MSAGMKARLKGRSLRGWITLLSLLALAVLSGPVRAHSSSNSYLSLSQMGPDLVLRGDINLRDIDLMFDLDRNRDGQVTWGETQARGSELEGWLAQGLSMSDARGVCKLQPSELMASAYADGTYLSAQWQVACPGASAANPVADGLMLRYSLIFDRDNLHRGLLRVDLPGNQSSLIFSPERPEARVGRGEGTGWAVFKRYVVEGAWHIWIGVDHVLFLLSLLLLAPLAPTRGRVTDWRGEAKVRPAFMDVLAVVTAFTVAHSITLGLSVLELLKPPADLIEPAIALSVVAAAVNNLLGRSSLKRWGLAFVFGLIHGFGFANVLLDLGLPGHQLALALAGFNLGVELGQIAIVLAFFPLAWALRNTAFYRWGVVVAGSAAIAVLGLAWTVQRLGWASLGL